MKSWKDGRNWKYGEVKSCHWRRASAIRSRTMKMSSSGSDVMYRGRASARVIGASSTITARIVVAIFGVHGTVSVIRLAHVCQSFRASCSALVR